MGKQENRRTPVCWYCKKPSWRLSWQGTAWLCCDCAYHAEHGEHRDSQVGRPGAAAAELDAGFQTALELDDDRRRQR